MSRKYLGKEYIERPKEFDKKSYDKTYRKENYKYFSTVIKPEIKDRIDNYCKEAGISKAEFLRRAIDMFENK